MSEKKRKRSKKRISKKYIQKHERKNKLKHYFFVWYKNEWKSIKFDNIESNKKEFHKSKQQIDLNLVHIDKIVIPDKFKHNDDSSKYFTGYKADDIIKPLCIILPQMSGYLKYFENGGKNMSFMIENDSVLVKYNEIWNKIKEMLGKKFHSQPVYDEKHITAKLKEFNGLVNTNLLGGEVPRDGVHYTCIACIIIDSVMKIEKRIIHKFI